MTWMELVLKIFLAVVNEKVLVILSVTSISILVMYYIPQKADFVITAAFTGLFGIVGYQVGKVVGRREGDIPPTNGKPPEVKP